MSRWIRPLAGLAVLAIAVAACGGSASQAPSTPGSSAAPGATATAPAATDAAVTPAPSTAEGAPNITTGAAALADLDSYKMKITMAMAGLESSLFSAFGDGMTLDSTIVMKPTKAADMKVSMGKADQKLEVGYRLIGDKAWINLGGDSWMESTAADAEKTVDSFAPGKMFGGFSNMAGMNAVGDETKNGVASTHYTASGTAVADALNTQLGLKDGTWTVDYWVAKDGGFPVAYVVEGKGSDSAAFSMALEISDINNPSNTIEAPTVGN